MNTVWRRLTAVGLAAGLLASSALAQGPQAGLEGGHIGALELSDFGADTAGAVKRGILNLDNAADRWVIDLRGNESGDLAGAADAVSLFVGDGALVYLRDVDGNTYTRTGQMPAQTVDPVIVLVGEGTAAGGELFAADIRDCKAGLVIGQRTRGVSGAGAGERVYSGGWLGYDVVGVLPHLSVAEEVAPQVARLLCAPAPVGSKEGYLRLHLAGRRWYVNLTQGEPETVRALLEAIPPQGAVYLGSGEDWVETTPAAVAAGQGLTGYAPRVFGDVSDSPYAGAINGLKTYGIVQGDQNGDYRPDAVLDRATLCALLAQAMDYPMSDTPPAFADTSAEAWYTPYVNTLYALGIVNGYDDGLFHPNDPIPHQQFMAILARIAANTSGLAQGALTAGPTEEALASGAYERYDGWARGGVWLLDCLDVWHADVAAIDPKAPTTREEAADDLWSMLTALGLLPSAG